MLRRQFSLLHLFCLLTVLSVLVAGIGRWATAYRNRSTLQLLEQSAQVTTSPEGDVSITITRSSLNGKDIDAVLDLASSLPFMTVTLSGVPLGTATLPMLARFDELKRLIVENTVLCAPSPNHFPHSISVLAIRRCRLDQNTLDSIASLPNLRRLSLQGSDLSTLHLTAFSASRLSSLNLAFTEISDQHVYPLYSLASIEHLALSGTCISDSSAIALCGLPHLSNLELDDTRISEDCLPYFYRSTTLVSVSTERTSIRERFSRASGSR